MTSKMLKKEQALLLQSHVDGETTDDERREATKLLEQLPAARVYVAALKSLGEALRAAEKQAWQRAVLGSADEWTALAESSLELAQSDLDDLAPLLERFFDGEADETEAAVVAALIDEREDVAQYISELDRLSVGIRQAHGVDDVDFDDFWDGVAQGIDEVDDAVKAAPVTVEPFDENQHQMLLYRYHDGEVSAEERRLVEAWIETKDNDVDATLGALAEVNLGVNAGIEMARERAELDDIWSEVSHRLDAIDAERAADNVVALDAAPESGAPQKKANFNRPLFALVASIALLMTGALVGQQLLQQSDDGLATQQKVVIFDSIESAPGSSVMLRAPQLAEHNVDYEAAYNGQYLAPEIDAADDEADPTVLWVIDENDDDDDDDDDDDPVELPGPI